jgi:hypothetical protein
VASSIYYYEGIGLRFNPRHVILRELLHYCISENKKSIRRYQLWNRSGLGYSKYNRALDWLEDEGLVRVKNSKGTLKDRRNKTRISPTKKGERELRRLVEHVLQEEAKKKIAQGLPFDRIAKAYDKIEKVRGFSPVPINPNFRHEPPIPISDSVKRTVKKGRLSLFLLFLCLFFRHTVFNNCVNYFLKVSYFGR